MKASHGLRLILGIALTACGGGKESNGGRISLEAGEIVDANGNRRAVVSIFDITPGNYIVSVGGEVVYVSSSVVDGGTSVFPIDGQVDESRGISVSLNGKPCVNQSAITNNNDNKLGGKVVFSCP